MSRHHIFTGALLVTLSAFPLQVLGAEQSQESAKGAELLSSAQSEEQSAADAAAQPRREGTRPGIAKDQLQACLEAIPPNSSAGQRMLAEKRCHDEQEARISSHAAPSF